MAGRPPRPAARCGSSKADARLKGASSVSTGRDAGLQVLPAGEPVRDHQAERRDLRLHLGDVLPAGLLVGAALQAPFEVPLGPRGAGLPEHVEADDVPLVDRALRLRLPVGPTLRELLELLLAVRDMALLLAQDHGQSIIDR